MSLPDQSIGPKLTTREYEILRLIAQGYENKEIAKMLGIVTGTVDFHVHSILRKLGVANRAQAVAVATHLGLIDDNI
jgi:LuxR family transcriptional regulator, maltose regulon positive regulatory protein